MAGEVAENIRGHWMDTRRWRRFSTAVSRLLGIGVFALTVMSAPAAQAQGKGLVRNRILGPIRSAHMQAIPGTVHPLVSVAHDQGPLNGSTRIEGMSLVFHLSSAQQADLQNLLEQQQTVGSPLYHRWLGPGQFAARYGVSAADLAKVAAWLQTEGFHVDAIPASADRINFSGTAAQVETTFGTRMDRYLLHGQSLWANATEIRVPQAIAGIALGVQHLNTFRPLARSIKRQPVHLAPHSAGTPTQPHYSLCDVLNPPCNFLAPADIQTIYNVDGLYSGGITGTGQTMAVVGQTDIVKYQSDIAHFRSLSGLDANNMPTQIVVPNSGTAAASPGDLAEADLDVEWSGAVAKDAKILYVTVGNNNNYTVFDSLQYAIQTPLVHNGMQFVPVISISYGACEQAFAGSGYIEQFFETVLEQANAQGQTVVASSGDSGSADCDGSSVASLGLAVDYPSSSQYVTAAGGTTLSGDQNDPSSYWNQSNDQNNGSALQYIPESAWNNTPAGTTGAGGLSAGGGGASTLFSKPSWQVGPGVPNDGKRDVPDVSLAADPNHDGYVLCTQETNTAGTAFLTPRVSSCVYPVGTNQVAYFDASGSGYLYGGTSVAAPQIAAMITLWNQQAGNTSGVGNANPIFYLTAENVPGAFHDTTTGNNAVVCQAGSPNCVAHSSGYGMSCCNAGPGYDKATGLGSFDASAMGAVWLTSSVTAQNPPQPIFSMVPNPSAISLRVGGSTNVSLVLSPGGAGSNSAPGFSGTVNLACSNLPAGVTCGFDNAAVALSPGAAKTVTLTVSASTSAAVTAAAHPPLPAPSRHWPMPLAFAGIFGLSLLGLRRKRRFPSQWVSRSVTVLLLAAGLMAAVTVTACGSSSPTTSGNGGGSSGNSTTSTITVTGTSANVSVVDRIQLTITS